MTTAEFLSQKLLFCIAVNKTRIRNLDYIQCLDCVWTFTKKNNLGFFIIYNNK